MTFNFFGQPQYSGTTPSEIIGYELLLRHRIGKHWVLPAAFPELPAAEFERLLQAAIARLPHMPRRLSLNLERRHFIDERFFAIILRLQARVPAKLTVELTERHDPAVTNQQLIAAAKRYHSAGIDLCIDDIGSGDSMPGFVEGLAPYVSTYKFNLHHLRQALSEQAINERFHFWRQRARYARKRFHVAGVESLDELTCLRQGNISESIQGYYFGVPTSLAGTSR